MARNSKNTRMCSGCMARRDKAELICINKGENGVTIQPGICKKQGRSAYLCPNSECMEKSIKKKSLPRSLKCEIPPEFYNTLREFFNSINQE